MNLIGDVLFFKRKECLLSKLANKITSDEFTDVGLIIGYDETSGIATIVEEKGFVKTRISRIRLNDSHQIYSTGYKTEEETRMIVRYAKSEVGRVHSYLSVFQLFSKLFFQGDKHDIFNMKNKIISSLIGTAYYRAGIIRNNDIDIGDVTPKKLLNAYDLKLNRKQDVYNLREVRKKFPF